ncbi:CDGSH iron-sulfur domain-containing protein [Picrophilus oshimae]|uniref:Zn-finger domain of CDGSH type-containing protein n=1 Tax=Picrophilus torridus (strain ATCC 700027 / DSM 9790 / JCM 10055 / NBRC 100828 / KAW 2/3) TaxID=1122961 RepID=A0A8G2FW05_PICTO|nr:CDGSH iron-sulfur domain-containing protein [Picrophilus oshimae]SMD30502.1 Zn-finger domain of CDGSH type-containing protein [Picrophilus oshimae DSM 9789]
MARLVLHERNRPYVVKIGNEELYLCGCGLSENKPYCDGHHTKTVNEGDKIFIYNHDGSRVEISSFYNNP